MSKIIFKVLILNIFAAVPALALKSQQKCYQNASVQGQVKKEAAVGISDTDLSLRIPNGVVQVVDQKIFFITKNRTQEFDFDLDEDFWQNTANTRVKYGKVLIAGESGRTRIYLFENNGAKKLELGQVEFSNQEVEGADLFVDGTVVLRREDGFIYFYDSEGKAKATYNPGRMRNEEAFAVSDDGSLLVVGYSRGNRHELHLVDSSGRARTKIVVQGTLIREGQSPILTATGILQVSSHQNDSAVISFYNINGKLLGSYSRKLGNLIDVRGVGELRPGLFGVILAHGFSSPPPPPPSVGDMPGPSSYLVLASDGTLKNDEYTIVGWNDWAAHRLQVVPGGSVVLGQRKVLDLDGKVKGELPGKFLSALADGTMVSYSEEDWEGGYRLHFVGPDLSEKANAVIYNFVTSLPIASSPVRQQADMGVSGPNMDGMFIFTSRLGPRSVLYFVRPLESSNETRVVAVQVPCVR